MHVSSAAARGLAGLRTTHTYEITPRGRVAHVGSETEIAVSPMPAVSAVLESIERARTVELPAASPRTPAATPAERVAAPEAAQAPGRPAPARWQGLYAANLGLPQTAPGAWIDERA